MEQTLSIRITGKVQGVFYRQSAKEKALQLGVTGQVSNEPDGSVNLLATGNEEQLASLLSWCKQGPSRSSVTAVESKPMPLQHFDTFLIIRD